VSFAGDGSGPAVVFYIGEFFIFLLYVTILIKKQLREMLHCLLPYVHARLVACQNSIRGYDQVFF
jgi:hypothetical protein